MSNDNIINEIRQLDNEILSLTNRKKELNTIIFNSSYIKDKILSKYKRKYERKNKRNI